MPEPFTSPAVVIGVDGSRAGVRAALWAIPRRAAARFPPPGLLHRAGRTASGRRGRRARRRRGGDPRGGHRGRGHRAAGQGRNRDRRGPPDRHAAGGIPVGGNAVRRGGRHPPSRAQPGRLHRRGAGGRRAPPGGDRPRQRAGGPRAPGWVVVELDESPDSATVLACGVEGGPAAGCGLRVLGSWQSRYTDVHDSHAVADGNRMVRAVWTAGCRTGDTATPTWTCGRCRYTAAPCTTWPSTPTDPAGGGRRQERRERRRTDRPVGLGALHNDCSILIADRQRLL